MNSITQKVSAALESFEGEDFSLSALAEKLGTKFDGSGRQTLIIDGSAVEFERTGWLKMGHQYSLMGQWSPVAMVAA